MVLNYIWIAFFLIAFAVALVRLVFLGDTQVFPEIINSTFSSSKTAFEISLGFRFRRGGTSSERTGHRPLCRQLRL